MMHDKKFWNKAMETLPPEMVHKIQEERLMKQLDTCGKIPGYTRKSIDRPASNEMTSNPFRIFRNCLLRKSTKFGKAWPPRRLLENTPALT